MSDTAPRLLLAALIVCTSIGSHAAEEFLRCTAPDRSFAFILRDANSGSMTQGDADCSFAALHFSDGRPTPVMTLATIRFTTVGCPARFTTQGYMKVEPARNAPAARAYVMALRASDPLNCELSSGSIDRLTTYLDARRAQTLRGAR
jgi:hypothetical protein